MKTTTYIGTILAILTFIWVTTCPFPITLRPTKVWVTGPITYLGSASGQAKLNTGQIVKAPMQNLINLVPSEGMEPTTIWLGYKK